MPQGLTDAQLIDKLNRLEKNVALIASHLGIALDDPAAALSPEVRELARTDRIQAAKLHSEQTGADFLEAQRVVNQI
jgi:hypothetical protein